MRALVTEIPDPDVLLALETEELAAKMLMLLKKKGRGRYFIVETEINDIGYEDHSRGATSYPREKLHEVQRAVSEGFSWLQAQALIVPEPGYNYNTHMILSRRAERFDSEQDFRQFEMARRLNRDMLHPAIAEKVWLGIIRGDFAEAVFTAMRAVEIAVRGAGGYGAKKIGTDLMRAAFKPGEGPLADLNAEPGEQQALADLFAGAIGSYKNPHSHRSVPMDDAGEAIEIVTLASHLLRIIDARRPAQQDRQTDEA